MMCLNKAKNLGEAPAALLYIFMEQVWELSLKTNILRQNIKWSWLITSYQEELLEIPGERTNHV